MKYIYWPIFIPLTPLHLFGQSIFPADKPHSLVPSFLPPSPFVASLLQQPTILFLSSSLSSSFPCPFLSIASLLSLIDIHSLSEASVRLGHKSLRTLMKRSSSWYLPGESISGLARNQQPMTDEYLPFFFLPLLSTNCWPTVFGSGRRKEEIQVTFHPMATENISHR